MEQGAGGCSPEERTRQRGLVHRGLSLFPLTACRLARIVIIRPLRYSAGTP